MNPEALLRQFDVLADAPNGVQKLRELILRLAVHGKLVPQEPNDEPASALLERIGAEKQRLFKEGRIGKPKSPELLADDEVPYQLPESWRWVRLSSIGEIVGGGTPKTEVTSYWSDEAGVPWLTPADLNGLQGKFVCSGRRQITDRGLQNSSARLLPAGAVLFSSRAPIGYVAIAANPLATNQGFKSCVPYLNGLTDYVYRFLQAVAPEIDRNAPGTTFREVSGKIVGNVAVPLPPLPEQRRIVAKVDELMALCDKLETQQQRRAGARVRLNRSSLHHLTADSDDAELAAHWERLRENFHLLYDTPETVGELRQAVLQLAVRGRLVPFDPAAHSRTLGSILAEGSLNGLAAKPHDEAIGTPVLRISAGTSRQDAIVDETDHKYLNVDPEIIAKFCLTPGDLLACRFNGNLHYVGRISLYSGNSGTTQIYPDKLIRFRVDREQADPAYIRYAFNARDTRAKIESYCATTAGNIGISAGRLKTIAFPVPPLPEQRRVVAKVDQLLALCDRLEARLSAVREKSAHVAASVVHHLTTV